jgi:hypothetical protein
MDRNTLMSSEYTSALGRGTALICMVLAVVIWDRLAVRITFIAILGYLGGVAVMVIRRPQAPTATDLRLLQWGFLPLWFMTQIVARIVWY